MCRSNCCFQLVSVLSTGATSSHVLPVNVSVVELYFVWSWLRQADHSDCRRLYSSTFFCRGHSLKTVTSRFVSEDRTNTRTVDSEDPKSRSIVDRFKVKDASVKRASHTA
jgi:hypothetical protein